MAFGFYKYPAGKKVRLNPETYPQYADCEGVIGYATVTAPVEIKFDRAKVKLHTVYVMRVEDIIFA